MVAESSSGPAAPSLADEGVPPARAGVGTESLSAGRLGSLARNGILVALALEILFFWVVADNFMTGANVQVILLQSAIVGMLAVPSAIVLMAGYVDLSVGAAVGLSAVVFGQVATSTDSTLFAVVMALVVATALGTVNGLFSANLGFSPIVVTLGTLAAGRGIALVISDGKSTSGFDGDFAYLGRGRVRLLGTDLELPMPVLIALALFALGGLFLYQTAWGRHLIAIGVNAAAAHHAGIRITRLPFLFYVITGLVAGLAGLTLVSRLNSAPPTAGDGLEIDVLTAVLLGGVAFGGGRGSLLGVAAGVLFIRVLGNGLILAGVSPFWVTVSSGVALVCAAALDALGRALTSRSAGGGSGGGLRLGFGGQK